jgi:hypothetical protein
MSYIAIPFAVDYQKVKNIFGSRDKILFEKVKATQFYYNYASQSLYGDPKYHYDLEEILYDIIFNYIKPEDRKTKNGFLGLVKSTQGSGLKENKGHAYGYALIAISSYLGTHLLPNCDGFYCGDWFEEAHMIIRSNGLKVDIGEMFEQHNIFDIPKPIDFPTMFCFSKIDIAHVNSIMSNVEIDEEKADDDSDNSYEVQEMLKNIRDSFKTCADNNVEMVTFAH